MQLVKLVSKMAFSILSRKSIMTQKRKSQDGKRKTQLTALNPSMSYNEILESLLKGLMNSGVPVKGGKEMLEDLQKQKK